MPVVCIPLIRFTLLLSFVGNLFLSLSPFPNKQTNNVCSNILVFFRTENNHTFSLYKKKQTKKKREIYIKTDYATKQTKNADMIFTGVITATYTHNPENETTKIVNSL